MAVTSGNRSIYTVGHSTRSLADFVALLKRYGIGLLADVRTIPRSRHNPQFNADALQSFLPSQGIGYQHLKELGGLRHSRADSPNTGWRNASFRGFADYMQTPAFEATLLALLELAQQHTVALMCAEAVPWRCHRSLIADALVVRGIDVTDIFDLTHARPHTFNSLARVEGGTLTYPAAEPVQEPLLPALAASSRPVK
ncbi:DUF488 domain-containing protein [Trichlorobacter lovleyi]|uniref:DUF488 domain-containing protein n=1 Tax=Trichlorobacter lovleyi TaxID=313985 RepID=UPI00223F59AC|nr:DUF488 domain-containing protein [Trichlorobacter lovleyi]QOX78197.1 DUF488 domain-containing protein [Trichlorobacter lovleyi]